MNKSDNVGSNSILDYTLKVTEVSAAEINLMHWHLVHPPVALQMTSISSCRLFQCPHCHPDFLKE